MNTHTPAHTARRPIMRATETSGDRFNLVAASEAATRNARPIARAIAPFVRAHAASARGMFDFYELACGDGAHAATIARELRGAVRAYDPSDLTSSRFDVVRANARGAGVEDVVRDARTTDASTLADVVDAEAYDGIVVVNMCHISSRNAVLGMFAGAKKALRRDGLLFAYGPFTRDGGKFSGPGDEKFDASLRSRDPVNFGLVDVETFMDVEAARCGLVPDEEHPVAMPANNLLLVYRKA